MGLNLFHYQIVNLGKLLTDSVEIINVANFPEDFKKKFSKNFFLSEVEYIDWELTIAEMTQLTMEEFSSQFERFAESEDGVFHFCVKGAENPWADPNRFAISTDQCKKVMINDPHIHAVCVGNQRGCMKSEFFNSFDSFEVVIDEDRVKTLTKFCENPECAEMFIQNFILNWNELSFMIVEY